MAKDSVKTIVEFFKLTSTKFSFKLGLVAGAAYYLSEQGIWKNSSETTKLYEKMSENLSPYLQQAKEQLNIEIPPLPTTNQVSFLAKRYWNQGITATFMFVGDLPQSMNVWTKKGVAAVMDNEGIKKYYESFSGTSAQGTNVK